jgi:hypothetical protein
MCSQNPIRANDLVADKRTLRDAVAYSKQGWRAPRYVSQ